MSRASRIAAPKARIAPAIAATSSDSTNGPVSWSFAERTSRNPYCLPRHETFCAETKLSRRSIRRRASTGLFRSSAARSLAVRYGVGALRGVTTMRSCSGASSARSEASSSGQSEQTLLRCCPATIRASWERS
jgi:hypothetical protein